MNFQWIDCSFYLKKLIRNTEVTVNLAPSYKLKYSDQELEPKDINLNAKIMFEKPLMYDQVMGWNWHKSWNIPDISVQLTTSDIKAASALKNMKRLFAQIYIVKPLISKQYSLCFEDLGLQGITRNPVGQNRTLFSGLKYSATSYNSDGSKFHFLLVVYQQSEHPDDPWKVLLSKISTPVFVDSRKSAREAQLIKLKRLSAFIEPFESQQIQKKFIKKQSKRQHEYVEQPIQLLWSCKHKKQNKAPNILGIHTNSKLMELAHQQSQIKWVQSSLQQTYKTFQAFNKPPTKTQNKKLILMIKGKDQCNKTNYYKKILQFIESLQNEYIEICTEQPIYSNFKKLQANQETLRVYGQFKEQFEKNHDFIYKNKQQELKSHAHQFEKRQQIEQEPQIQEQQALKIEQIQPVQQRISQQQKNDQQQQRQESEDESISSIESFQDQRINIPLKCEINIDPLKKKPMKMSQIIKHHEAHKAMTSIKCQKNKSANQKQLIVLNQLMRVQIQQMKKTLQARKIQSMPMHDNMHQLPQRQNLIRPQQNPVKIQSFNNFFNNHLNYDPTSALNSAFSKYHTQ